MAMIHKQGMNTLVCNDSRRLIEAINITESGLGFRVEVLKSQKKGLYYH